MRQVLLIVRIRREENWLDLFPDPRASHDKDKARHDRLRPVRKVAAVNQL
jgi:hypothetical protein